MAITPDPVLWVVQPYVGDHVPSPIKCHGRDQALVYVKDLFKAGVDRVEVSRPASEFAAVVGAD